MPALNLASAEPATSARTPHPGLPELAEGCLRGNPYPGCLRGNPLPGGESLARL